MLSSKDHNHVKKFCKFVGIDENRIKLRFKSSILNGRTIAGEECKIGFCSSYMSKCLENLGMVRAKSLILKFPNDNIVNKDMMRHFIRGFWMEMGV